VFWHNVHIPDEHTLTLRKADQARSDFAAIEAEFGIIQAQLARLPTRRELSQIALLATLAGAALVLAGIEAFFR
jgi:hypothetical protein